MNLCFKSFNFFSHHSVTLIEMEGNLLCKFQFFMYFLHKHVSPLCKEILKVSGKKILSLFVLIHLYKNLLDFGHFMMS